MIEDRPEMTDGRREFLNEFRQYQNAAWIELSGRLRGTRFHEVLGNRKLKSMVCDPENYCRDDMELFCIEIAVDLIAMSKMNGESAYVHYMRTFNEGGKKRGGLYDCVLEVIDIFYGNRS